MESLISSLSVSENVSKSNPRKRSRKQFEATDSDPSELPNHQDNSMAQNSHRNHGLRRRRIIVQDEDSVQAEENKKRKSSFKPEEFSVLNNVEESKEESHGCTAKDGRKK